MPVPAADQMHPTIRALYEHWRAIHPEAGLPGRQHFDPLAIPRLLPNVWLLDVEAPVVAAGQYRFRYRVIGSAIAREGPPVRTGQWLDEAITDPPLLERAYGFLADTVTTKVPNWRRGPPTIGHRRHVGALEVIVLPLARDGATVDALLNATVFWVRSSASPAGGVAG